MFISANELFFDLRLSDLFDTEFMVFVFEIENSIGNFSIMPIWRNRNDVIKMMLLV